MISFQSKDFAFVLLILLGFVTVRCRMIEKDTYEKIPALLFSICYPAVILDSIAVVDLGELRGSALYMLCFSFIAAFVIFCVSALVLRRYNRKDRKELILFSLVIGNVTFIGIPFIQVLFGELGISLAIIYGLGQDILIWSLFYGVFSGEKLSCRAILGKLANPCFICLIAGLVMAAVPLPLPDVIRQPLSMVAGITTPLALLFIGSVLAANLSVLRHPEWEAFGFAAVKSILLPIIIWLVLALFPVPMYLRNLSVFLAALPAPLLTVIFARQFGKDERFAVACFIYNTLLFVILCTGLTLMFST